MLQKKCWFTTTGSLIVLAVPLILPLQTLAAIKYKVLHRFTAHKRGDTPTSLTLDQAGNLYGTASLGSGFVGDGFVFKLTPNSQGGWTESTLYSFCSLTNCADGKSPNGPLVFDASGNLYGTTQLGGDSNCQPPYGCGTVFKLKPNPDGSWTESVLHGFTGGTDGFQPLVGVTFDASGNLYGTTISGGSSDKGTVFELKPNADGSYTESVLYNFCSITNCADGAAPYGGVITDAAGNLYTNPTSGGDLRCNAPYGCGAIIRLKPNSDGSWTESLLYSFKGGADGRDPGGTLIFDQAGNLYGTTPDGGGPFCNDGCGTAFKLKPNPDGSWTENVLHRFTHKPAVSPVGLTFDKSGNLYGPTFAGGPVDEGTVFRLKPNSDGSWAFHTLHIFLGKPAASPDSPLILDKTGNLYGTTYSCGTGCEGVVFEITP